MAKKKSKKKVARKKKNNGIAQKLSEINAKLDHLITIVRDALLHCCPSGHWHLFDF